MGASQSTNSAQTAALADDQKSNKKIVNQQAAVAKPAADTDHGSYVSVVFDDQDGESSARVLTGALVPRGNIYSAAVSDHSTKLLPEYFIGRDCLQREQERLANAVAMERCARRAGGPCDGTVTVAVKKNADGTSTTVVETETLRAAKNQFEGESQRLLKNWNQKRAAVDAGNKQRNGALVDASQTLGRDSVAKQPLVGSAGKFYDE